jgi:hypothetical protein
MATTSVLSGSSFRDPCGFVFRREGCAFRQVNLPYQPHYDHLLESGLYEALTSESLLIPHEETDEPPAQAHGAYKVLKPLQVPFISYPYEWCFSQLKDAALTTLAVQKRALEFGMTLKDSSAYNVQFLGARPVFIDTLSFERHREGSPWVGYRQFCQHFLAPLALMSYTDVRLGQLLRIHIDGVPLDLASRLLPFRSRLRFSVLAHVHLHARSQKHFEDKPIDLRDRKVSRLALAGLIESLARAVARLQWKPRGTEWAEYYDQTNYAPEAMGHKEQLVAQFLDEIRPEVVWDLGANTGVFSRIAARRARQTISFDVDPAAVERNYLQCRRDEQEGLLPLVADLTNPSPALGWAHAERASLADRAGADVALALALVHHLAIGNNLPFGRIAEFLRSVCRVLIIEFVPKADSQVQRMLATREDIFASYHQQAFEESFGAHFEIRKVAPIRGSRRILYLMARR